MKYPACPGCGAPDPASSPTRAVYAVRGFDEPPWYACDRACYASASAAALQQLTCKECQNAFDRPRWRGRVPDYCSRACQSAADRRRDRVWKSAAKAIVPTSHAGIVAALGDVEFVITELAERRTTVPKGGRGLLSGYRASLEAAKVHAERAGLPGE